MVALSRLGADVEDELRGEGEDVLDWTGLPLKLITARN